METVAKTTLLSTPFSVTKADGKVIRGQELVMDDGKTHPTAMIFSHGFTGSMNETRPYAEELAKSGIRCFIYDFCGGGFHTISDGSFEDDMTPLTEVSDLKDVINWVRQQPNIKKIVLEGHSQGGFVSSLVAAEDPEIAGLILQYPALCIPDDARKGSMQVIKFDPENIPDHIGVSPWRVSGEYARSVLHMDIFKEIVGYKGPVLIIHGTVDPVVPYSYAIRAAETYKANGNPVTLQLIPNAGHGFKDQDLAESVDAVEHFLKKYSL